MNYPCKISGRKLISRLLLLIIIPYTCSCASILNGRYQKIAIRTDKQTTLTIDQEEPDMSNGRYKVKRDLTPKQLTVSREGHKDRNFVIMQFRKSPLYIMSWIPFAIVYMLPPLFDSGKKSYNYEPYFDASLDLAEIPEKDSLSRQILVNNVAVKLDKEDINYRYFPSYRNFRNKKLKEKAKNNREADPVEIENTVFPSLLNDMLVKGGYIDTTSKIFKRSYRKNLNVNATIEGYTFNFVRQDFVGSLSGMVFVELDIKWEVLDYYDAPVFTVKTKSTSDQFAVVNYNTREEKFLEALTDAMEYGLIKFINHREVDNLLHGTSEHMTEEVYPEMILPCRGNYAENIKEVVAASVTIKNSKGHGSGFLISHDGHIITNYHVISDTSDLRVVTNDLKEHKAEIVRISKSSDLALLKINTQYPAPLRINGSHDIEIATDIYAVGTPSSEELSQTVSKGIVSGIRKGDFGNSLIQTDASINGGNSGGAIVTRDAVVLGVVSAKLTGFGIEGVAFGIPSYEILDKLKIRIDSPQVVHPVETIVPKQVE